MSTHNERAFAFCRRKRALKERSNRSKSPPGGSTEKCWRVFHLLCSSSVVSLELVTTRRSADEKVGKGMTALCPTVVVIQLVAALKPVCLPLVSKEVKRRPNSEQAPLDERPLSLYAVLCDQWEPWRASPCVSRTQSRLQPLSTGTQRNNSRGSPLRRHCSPPPAGATAPPPAPSRGEK